MSDSVRQWGRVAQVIVGRSGTGLNIENLRISFEVTKTIDSTPNSAIIKIYNLNPVNEAKIKNEFDEVILNAGYQGAARLVFRGNIKHVFRYRDGADYITEIEGADGDKDYHKAVMNETLAAGTTNSQLIDRAVGSFAGGTIKGSVQIQDRARIRGKVVSGNTRDILSDFSRETGSNWSIQDGQLVIVGSNDILKGEAIVITSETGMLESPEVTDKGVIVKCLMNPLIRINGAIQLDNNGFRIRRQKEKAKKLNLKEEPMGELVRLDPDGIYKVIKLIHKGDNRASEWRTESTAIGLDQPIPKTKN